MAWIPSALAGVGAVTGLAQRLGSRRPDVSRALASIRSAAQPGAADYRAAEQTRGRLASSARRQGGLATMELARRYNARGLGTSPAQERDIGRINDQTAMGVQGAGDTAEEQLYNTQMAREQEGLSLYGGEANRQLAQTGEFWNSMNEFMPALQKYYGPTTGATTSTGAYAAPTPSTPSSGYGGSGGGSGSGTGGPSLEPSY